MSCEHQERRLTRRVIRSGAVQYVYQCVTCGRSMNQPIAHAQIRREFAGVEIPDFDEALTEKYTQALIEAAIDEVALKQEDFRDRYAAYLGSAVWADRRRLVLARCKGMCEGCGTRKAVEVHHLTYEHVFDEFLFELVGLCKPCHDRVHADQPGRE